MCASRDTKVLRAPNMTVRMLMSARGGGTARGRIHVRVKATGASPTVHSVCAGTGAARRMGRVYAIPGGSMGPKAPVRKQHAPLHAARMELALPQTLADATQDIKIIRRAACLVRSSTALTLITAPSTAHALAPTNVHVHQNFPY